MMKLKLYDYSAPVDIEGPDGRVITVEVMNGTLITTELHKAEEKA